MNNDAVKNIPEKLTEIIRKAHQMRASDLFFVPGEPPCIRIKNVIERMEEKLLTAAEIESAAKTIFSDNSINKIGAESGEMHKSLLLSEDANLIFSLAKTNGRFSLAVQIVMPVIVSEENTGLPESLLRAADNLRGLILISGAVGSGKTTSAYSLIEYINKNKPCHICSVEDPVYCRFTPKKALIQQREVGTDIPDILSGINASIRQDLDVLYLGDLKSYEELQTCINIAENGHLVVSVMHSNGAEDAISRITNIYPEEIKKAALSTLSSIIAGVSFQKLFTRIDKKGQVAAYEIIVPDDNIRGRIKENKGLEDFSTAPGCQTIAQSIKNLVTRGIIAAP